MIEANMGKIKFEGTGIELEADIRCIIRSYRSMMYEVFDESFALNRLRELEDMIIDALYMDDDDYDKKLVEKIKADGISEKLIKMLLEKMGGNIDDDSESETV